MSTRRKPPATPSTFDNDTYREPPLNGSPPDMATSTTTRRATRRSPFMPTSLEILLISIYPATLLLGSAFAMISPLTRNVPYSATTQSHPTEFAPTYFAKKKNLFNVFFVKVGWFWITLAISSFLVTHPSLGPPLQPVVTPRRARLVFRYGLITMWWVFVTQWFFGPPWIDTIFRFTGGQCQLLKDEEAKEEMSDTRLVATHAACKLAGGQWKGGHDISGHVFLLILGSAMLWFEILPTVLRAEGLRDGRTIMMADGKVATAAAEAQRETHAGKDGPIGFGMKAAVFVLALSWWMLLMTAAFFHTWFEKFTGLLTAFVALYAVYFLPRAIPSMRAVLGMPGV